MSKLCPVQVTPTVHPPRLSEKVFQGASSSDMIESLKAEEAELEDPSFLKRI